MNAAEVLHLLDRWREAGWLREVDRVFAAFLHGEAPDASGLLLLGAALASHQLGRGHVCIDLAATLADPEGVLAIPAEPLDLATAASQPPTPADALRGVALSDWMAALRHPELVADGAGSTPLALSGSRLYLRRFREHERTVRDAIQSRLAAGAAPEAEDTARLRAMLCALFPRSALTPSTDWQKVSCALALRSRFAVITGGPGTGKTTTVVKLLALLQTLALQGGQSGEGGKGPGPEPRPLRIRLAAPTGKAAARLNTSISDAVQKLDLRHVREADAVRKAIPTEVTTVHRLMGSMGGLRRFRHDAQNRLPLDVLVLDEASMVALETMAAVLEALPPGARLVLLGDKDQLASVEAGGVLGELCRSADAGHYLPEVREWLQVASGELVDAELEDPAGRPLDQAVAKLRHSYRFKSSSGIGRLAAAVNAGDVAEVAAIRGSALEDLAWQDLDARGVALRKLVLEGARHAFAGQRADGTRPVGYAHYLQVLRAQRPAPDAPEAAFDAWAKAVLDAQGQFQLLCAVRKGEHGVERLNAQVAALLEKEGLIGATQGWYAGRPVMVTRNDYGLRLMNGDVGVTLERPASREPGAPAQWMPRVAFPASDGGIHWVSPARLQDVETVYAMTVHKSQGSEFTHVALVLPDAGSRVLTRELVYTGITRARTWFTVAGPQETLMQAIDRPTRRVGGLLMD